MPATARMRSLAVLPLVLLSLLLASILVTPTEAHAATRGRMISNALAIAKHQIGDPYRYGAAGPGAFDCSGLLFFSYRRAGFSNIPRSSDAQYRWLRHIRKPNLRPGDFLFFHNRGDVYHAAIFVGWRDGHRVVVHSPSSGSRVHKSRPWTDSWFAATLRR